MQTVFIIYSKLDNEFIMSTIASSLIPNNSSITLLKWHTSRGFYSEGKDLYIFNSFTTDHEQFIMMEHGSKGCKWLNCDDLNHQDCKYGIICTDSLDAVESITNYILSCNMFVKNINILPDLLSIYKRKVKELLDVANDIEIISSIIDEIRENVYEDALCLESFLQEYPNMYNIQVDYINDTVVQAIMKIIKVTTQNTGRDIKSKSIRKYLKNVKSFITDCELYTNNTNMEDEFA